MSSVPQQQAAAALAQAARAVAQAAVLPRREPLSPAQAAEASLLAKSSKLEVARQAVLTQDLQQLAQADRAKVKRLEDKLLFQGQPQAPAAGDDVGDIIVCDDYAVNQGGSSSRTPLALAGAGVLLGAGAVIALTLGLGGDRKPAVQAPATPPAKVQAYDAVYEQQLPDGSWKVIKRERLRP